MRSQRSPILREKWFDGHLTTREAAEEFVKGDPFVLEGLIKRWQIREWNEAIA
jgi:hypothetical protein